MNGWMDGAGGMDKRCASQGREGEVRSVRGTDADAPNDAAHDTSLPALESGPGTHLDVLVEANVAARILIISIENQAHGGLWQVEPELAEALSDLHEVELSTAVAVCGSGGGEHVECKAFERDWNFEITTEGRGRSRPTMPATSSHAPALSNQARQFVNCAQSFSNSR